MTSRQPTRTMVAERLAAVPALATLPVDCRRALAEIGSLRTYAEGVEVLSEGTIATSFFAILDGRVKMTRNLATGRSLILSLFGPGDLFGTVAALGGASCAASMVTLEETRCLEVAREDLFALLAKQPELIGRLLPALTRHLLECKNCLVELTCYKVEMRFAQLFLRLVESLGRVSEAGVQIPVRLSRQELADLVGTTIETAIRVMSRWNKEGVVETRRDGFLVRDGARLERLAERPAFDT